MKLSSIGAWAVGAAVLAAIVLIVAGLLRDRPPPAPVAASSPGISASGFTLTSSSIDLPIDDQQFPPGPNVDVVDANCRSCHSASMALTQPKLSVEQWQATVIKMRDVYHAPVEAKDIDAIVGYFAALPTQGVDDAVPSADVHLKPAVLKSS